MRIRILCHILCLYIAVVFIQSLFFKFTGAPETIYIFGTLGRWSGITWFGNHGAVMVGTAELVAAILLFTPWRKWGALLGLLIMAGAIFFHLFTPLGVKMPEFDAAGNVTGNDGGLLFINACAVFVCAVIVFLLTPARKNRT